MIQNDLPNHERITPNSFASLQVTRDNFARLDTVELAMTVRKDREMQLTVVLGPLLLAILGVFARR